MSAFWNYDFMRYALISACILGPACALLGVFVTLRGMAFFSDALAHSAVTGVALGFLVQEKLSLSVDPMLCVFLFSFLLASFMAWLSHRTSLAPDTVIAFSFTGSVAFGVIVISMLGKYRLLDGILFGSIYANGPADILKQAALAVLICIVIVGQMRSYTLSTLSPEMAHVQRLRTGWLNYAFSLLIAATVAVCLKMLGALLLSALIIIPPAAAKLVSGSFRGLLVVSVVGGLLAATLGVLASWQLNVPTGPCIVLTDVLLLCVCYCWKMFGRVPSAR
jgi:zinc transport system permease protein